MTQDQFDWLQRQGAVLDLLSPEEKILDAPRTLAEANRMLSISAFDNLDYMEKKLFTTVRNIRARVGILSLSQRYDSLLMWAHYADLARVNSRITSRQINSGRTIEGDAVRTLPATFCACLPAVAHGR
jgi:hypothetical protein